MRCKIGYANTKAYEYDNLYQLAFIGYNNGNGTINQTRMHNVAAVQPHCPTCSARQGAALSRYSIKMKTELGL